MVNEIRKIKNTATRAESSRTTTASGATGDTHLFPSRHVRGQLDLAETAGAQRLSKQVVADAPTRADRAARSLRGHGQRRSGKTSKHKPGMRRMSGESHEPRLGMAKVGVKQPGCVHDGVEVLQLDLNALILSADQEWNVT